MADGNRKTWIIVALIAVLALVGVGVWWTQRDVEGGDGDAEANGDVAEVDREEALRRKRDA